MRLIYTIAKIMIYCESRRTCLSVVKIESAKCDTVACADQLRRTKESKRIACGLSSSPRKNEFDLDCLLLWRTV